MNATIAECAERGSSRSSCTLAARSNRPPFRGPRRTIHANDCSSRGSSTRSAANRIPFQKRIALHISHRATGREPRGARSSPRRIWMHASIVSTGHVSPVLAAAISKKIFSDRIDNRNTERCKRTSRASRVSSVRAAGAPIRLAVAVTACTPSASSVRTIIAPTTRRARTAFASTRARSSERLATPTAAETVRRRWLAKALVAKGLASKHLRRTRPNPISTRVRIARKARARLPMTA